MTNKVKEIVLTQEQIDHALELAIGGARLVVIAREIGFTTDMSFFRYRQLHPSFDKELTAARTGYCEHLEDDMLNVASVRDPQMARVKLEAMSRVMAFRNPARYNPKVDLNVSQTLDLTAVLTAANQRLIEPIRDVTPNVNDFKDLL